MESFVVSIIIVRWHRTVYSIAAGRSCCQLAVVSKCLDLLTLLTGLASANAAVKNVHGIRVR